MNDNNHNSDSENEVDESGARDHYVSVGKSKLRNEQPLLDDPRYAGKRTSRKDIYSEDEEEVEGVSESENDEELVQESDDQEQDSNDDEEDLVANANSDEEDDDEVDEEEQSETEDVEGDDEINAELRRIQEEEKYVKERVWLNPVFNHIQLLGI